MQVYCPQCGEQVPADDISLDRLLAKCVRCHAVFNLPDELTDHARRFHAAPQRPQRLADLPLPDRMEIDESQPGLKIRYRWFTPAIFLLAGFCLIWDGFLFVWYYLISQGITFTATGGRGPDLSLAICLGIFPLIHVALGLVLTYYVICACFNRTTVTAERGLLKIRHHPLPWPGSITIPTTHLKQLYCREYIRTSHRHGYHNYARYELRAILRDQRQKVLFRNFTDPEPILFLETAIEQHFGIRDEPVAGEHER